MPGFEISIRNEEVSRRLGLMTSKVQNKSDILRIIGNVGVEDIHQIFDESGYPAGHWKPSLRATISSGKTLIDRARLRGSINFQLQGNSSVGIGTNLKYASIHQFGGIIRAKGGGYLKFKLAGGGATTIGAFQTVKGHRRTNYGSPWRMVKQVTIPARPFILWTDRADRKVNQALTEYLTKLG